MGGHESTLSRHRSVQWCVIPFDFWNQASIISTAAHILLALLVDSEITLNTFVSKSHFDAHLYSDPFAVMNLMWDFARAKSKHSFCRRYSVSLMRIKQLAVTMHSLITRVAKHIGAPRESLEIKLPPVLMQHAKITVCYFAPFLTFYSMLYFLTHHLFIPTPDSKNFANLGIC